jgi:hypothetical protein
MSEFSESFQAYPGDRASVVSLLRTTGVGGWIVADNERCVSFVIDDPEREADVIAASRGVFARYYYGEDHGLWVRFYRDGQPLTALSLAWDPLAESAFDAEEQEAEPVAQVVDKLVGACVIGDPEAKELRRVLLEFSPEDPGSRERAVQTVPVALGFAAYRWLSMQYVLETEPEDLRRAYPGAEAVESQPSAGG